MCAQSFWGWTGKTFSDAKAAAELLEVGRNGGLNFSYLLTWNFTGIVTSTKLVSYTVLFVIWCHLLDA